MISEVVFQNAWPLLKIDESERGEGRPRGRQPRATYNGNALGLMSLRPDGPRIPAVVFALFSELGGAELNEEAWRGCTKDEWDTRVDCEGTALTHYSELE